MSKFITRTTRLTVLPQGEPIFSEMATHIEIEDEAAGEFITISQCRDDTDKEQEICIDPEEWPAIKAAVESLMRKEDAT